MESQHGHRWKNLIERIDFLDIGLIVFILLGAAVFVMGYALPSLLLQGAGGIIFGAALSASIGAITGRQAIHQQSAKEANLSRKREVYGPLHAELSLVRRAFDDAKNREAPAPLSIDNGVEVKRNGPVYVAPLTSALTLKSWHEFRLTFQYTDVKTSTQQLLDEIQVLVEKYNRSVESARQAAMPIIAEHTNVAIRVLSQKGDYKLLLQQHAAESANPLPLGHRPQRMNDWYGYIENAIQYNASQFGMEPGQPLAEQWLGRWPDPRPSQVIGWLLTGCPSKAANYVRENFPSSMDPPPPPDEWIQNIFNQAWPDVKQNTAFHEAMEAKEQLSKRVKQAEDMFEQGLRRIQKRFEGGEPLI